MESVSEEYKVIKGQIYQEKYKILGGFTMKSTMELKELLEEITEHVNRIDEEIDIYNLSDNDYRYMINNLITITLTLKNIK